MTDHPHVAVFHRVMAAFSAGDMDALAECFQPDVVWHIGGRNVALLHATASREGKELDMDYALVFHMRDSKIAEGWVVTTDPVGYDAFWASGVDGP